MSEPSLLSRQLTYLAEDLDRRHYPYAGVVRQAARALLAVEPERDGTCRGCGQDLVQPDTGRKREWCNDACRKRHARR